MEDPNKRLEMTAVEIQQEYYETIGDADWELYEKKDRRFLLQKIAVALCGPPSNEGNLMDCVKSNDTELKLQGYEARDEDTCMKVFDKILEQAKYSHNGENLIISVLRVVCVIPSREIKFFEITPKDYWLDLHRKKGASVHILVFHVFSIRKCISMNPKVKGCKVFIDHDARVYETWIDYLTENKLPKCVMVVPENGEYTGTIVKVLTAVRFYAVGSYQRCIGQEHNLALGQKTVSKVVREVSRAIVRRLFHTYVKFPGTAAERRAIVEGFQHKFGLPDCLGCVDCTHVAIVTPYNNNADDPSYGYKNRKGYYSINTQFVCDVNCRLLNVNARFPGSTHDQFIFNSSSVKREMNRLTDARIGKYYLIGDSGYVKEPYLITPILPTPEAGSPEHNYNVVLSQTRNCIERTNGIIKAVFRCLRKDRTLHYQPTAAAYIIIACCTIYNMMHEHRLPLPDIEDDDDDIAAEAVNEDDAAQAIGPRAAALRRQQEIINTINNN